MIYGLYDKAVQAEDAWEAELDRLFGRDAMRARYTAEGRGEDGSNLRRLHDAFKLAQEALLDTFNRSRPPFPSHA